VIGSLVRNWPMYVILGGAVCCLIYLVIFWNKK